MAPPYSAASLPLKLACSITGLLTPPLPLTPLQPKPRALLTLLPPLALLPLTLPRLLLTPPPPLLTLLARLLAKPLLPPPTLLLAPLLTLPRLLKTLLVRPRTLLKKPRSNNFCFQAVPEKPLVRQRLFLWLQLHRAIRSPAAALPRVNKTHRATGR